MLRPTAATWQADTAVLAGVPEGWARRLSDTAIVLFLVAQVAIPARYYLADHPASERFAWRMFSSTDVSKWNCTFLERVEEAGQRIERVVPIDGVLQPSTCKSIRELELDVISKFMRQWCQGPGVDGVAFEARGVAPSGRPLGPIRLAVDRVDGVVRRVEP
jgi:hypothetical protein